MLLLILTVTWTVSAHDMEMLPMIMDPVSTSHQTVELSCQLKAMACRIITDHGMRWCQGTDSACNSKGLTAWDKEHSTPYTSPTRCPCAGQGRGGSQGYDAALALQTKADVDELEKENIKSFAALEGEIAFSVVKVSSLTFNYCHQCPAAAQQMPVAKEPAHASQGGKEGGSQ